MLDSLLTQIEQRVGEVEPLYHRLVFLCGGDADGKSLALSRLGSSRNWPLINVSLSVAELLLDLPYRQRPMRVPQVLGELVEATGADTVILDHMELLFAPELAQDPLRLLQGLSRNRTLVVSWPGVVDGGQLIYAEPGHPEFHRYGHGDAVVVDATSAGIGSPI